MDTSQQPRDDNKITHKNSLFLSWCILLALCFAFVSAAPAAAGPNPAKYDKAIRDMGQLQKSKKRLQREPWEKLAETFLTVYRVEKKWKERSAALFRSAEALDHLARCASNAKDARRSVDRYLQLVRLYPKSSLADDSLYRAARLRGQILRDKAGAQELLQQILKKYPSSNTAKDASSYLATLSPKEKRQSPSAASKASKQKQPRGKPFRLGVKTVLIDPGHGGKDPGTHHNGIREKDLTLDISKRVGAILSSRGLNVRYTRRSDTWITLEQRADKVRTNKADLFISIHVNANPSEGVQGFETYYLDVSRTSASTRLAAVENALRDRSRATREKLPPLLKHHLRVDAAAAPQDHPTGADLKGSEGPLHAGKLRFLIAQKEAVLRLFQCPLRHQLCGVGVHIVKILFSPDGDHHRELFLFNTVQCRSSPPPGSGVLPKIPRPASQNPLAGR